MTKSARNAVVFPSRRCAVLAAVAWTASFAFVSCWVPAAAQVSESRAEAPRLLNSERIANRFGSYGIDVLESDERVRVSSLYSGSGADKTTRTFAVVLYPERLAPQLQSEHAEILRGGSIGAVFKRHGWQVRKTHSYFGELAATHRLAGLMRTAEGTALAVDAYVLRVSRAGEIFDYATIVEIHHPDYLRLDDLLRIYAGGRASGPPPDASVRKVLALVASKIR